MALKKQHFAEGEISIFDEAFIYKREKYWQFRVWFPKEKKYARKSLSTCSEATTIEKGKAALFEIYANLLQGKTYFSIATKESVKKHPSFSMGDDELGHIVKGIHTTIDMHQQHILSCISKDTRLKRLGRNVSKNYYYQRHKANKKVKQVTLENKQTMIDPLNEVKRLCKDFLVTCGTLKSSLTEGRKKS